MTIVLAAFAAAPAAAQQSPAPVASAEKWGASIDLDGKLGTNRDLGEADVFLPLAQDDRTLVFGDLRGKLDDKQSREGNVGLGVRRMLSGGWNIGGYGFYDRRHSHYDNGYNQVTIGAEGLGEDFDFRANGYIPFGERVKNVDSLNTAVVSGASVVFRGGEEHALYGFDAEVGWRVPIWSADAPQALRLYAGGYRFDDSTVDAVQGPRLRAELTLYEVPHLWDGARVTAGLEWQHDTPRGNQTFAGLRLRIPLQTILGGEAPRLTAQERRMTDPVVRDVDIVAQAGAFGPPETATQLANGNSFTVLNSATTTGGNLAAAVTAAGNGSTVILSGTFQVGTTGVSLAFNQTLMSGAVQVVSPSGRTAILNTTATIAGANATAGGPGAAVLVNAGGKLQGLTISNAYSGGSGGSAVLIGGTATGVNILGNTITVTQSGGSSGSALSFQNGNTGTVSGNTLTATGSGTATTMSALIANQGTTTITVSGNAFNATGGTTNNRIVQAGAAINAGSTGNIRGSGTCTGVPASGAISFTDGTTC